MTHPLLKEQLPHKYHGDIYPFQSPSKLNLFQQLILSDSSKIAFSTHNAALTDSKHKFEKGSSLWADNFRLAVE